MSHPIVSTPRQADLLAIPETPFVYWLRPRFFELLRGRTLRQRAAVLQGPSVGDDEAFVRYFWEIRCGPGRQSGQASGWVRIEKGGGYCRWFGHQYWVVDWHDNGSRIRAHASAALRNEDHFFRDGWVYSSLARGSLGVRILRGALWGSVLADAVFPRDQAVPGLGALLNARPASAAVRWLRPQMVLSGSYVERIPLPLRFPSVLPALERSCIDVKRQIIRRNLVEWTFCALDLVGRATHKAAPFATVARDSAREEAAAAILHALEGWDERLVCDAYALDDGDVQAILEETGTPAGWYPLIAGYDRLPDPPEGVELPDGFAEYFAGLQRRELSFGELARLKTRLRKLYEAGPGAKPDEEEAPADDGDGEDEAVLGAHIPIPTETFLEELSQKLHVHPVSVYRLLEELRSEGVFSPPEMKWAMEQWVEVATLLMLGYRWPEQDQQEAEHGPAIDPDLVDEDGVIPLVPCGNHPTAAQRIRELLERLFGEEGASRSEEEFRRWVGMTLDDWFRRRFFDEHTRRFKQRPIAWHLTSPEGRFQALVLYHRLSRELLQRLRATYAGALISGLQAEREKAKGDQERVSGLTAAIEDVEEFRRTLERIERGDEARYRIRCRWKGEEPDGRPGPYSPDLDDGVKVNIRPFQEAGLLARSVIKKW